MHLGSRVVVWSSCTLALVALLSASPRRVSGHLPSPQAAARQELTCPSLSLPDRTYLVPSGKKDKLEYPQHDGRIAVLDVPALATGLTFEFRAVDPVRARVDITARRTDDGTEVKDFSAHPLKLTLYVRDGCSPSKPASGQSLYIYVVEEPAGDGYGDYDGPLWPIKKTGSVKAYLCHLSGFILAQGNKPDRGGPGPRGRGNGGDRCP